MSLNNFNEKDLTDLSQSLLKEAKEATETLGQIVSNGKAILPNNLREKLDETIKSLSEKDKDYLTSLTSLNDPKAQQIIDNLINENK